MDLFGNSFPQHHSVIKLNSKVVGLRKIDETSGFSMVFYFSQTFLVESGFSWSLLCEAPGTVPASAAATECTMMATPTQLQCLASLSQTSSKEALRPNQRWIDVL